MKMINKTIFYIEKQLLIKWSKNTCIWNKNSIKTGTVPASKSTFKS